MYNINYIWGVVYIKRKYYNRMSDNRKTHIVHLLLVIFAALAFAFFVMVPEALLIPAAWFAGHLCLGLYRLVKPHLAYFFPVYTAKA